MNHNESRRRFIGNMMTMAGVGAAPLAINLAAMSEAAAATATDYKAIICLFMAGGNDHFSTLLLNDDASWATYSTIRKPDNVGSVLLDRAALKPITPLTADAQGRAFALHPNLPKLQALFQNKRAAVLANVGTLTQAIAKRQDITTTNAPPKLFSHNDQQSLWQAYKTEGADVGWGGRMADQMAANNGSAKNFTCVSTAGNVVFLTGDTVQQYQVTAAGAAAIERLNVNVFNSIPADHKLEANITAATANPIEQDYVDVVKRSIAAESVLRGAMLPATHADILPMPAYRPLNTSADALNPLTVQLQTVARIIGGRNTLQIKRQVFFVSLGGFDTHDNQLADHAELMAKLDHALDYFDKAMDKLGGTDLRNRVTLFTASDFGRTLTSNGDGTDHGWGSHHFIVGGAVKGGDIYGVVPPMGLKHDWDVSSGSLLPTIAVEQYAATLAKWFGLNTSEISATFATLGNFSTPDLGFMKPA